MSSYKQSVGLIITYMLQQICDEFYYGLNIDALSVCDYVLHIIIKYFIDTVYEVITNYY